MTDPTSGASIDAEDLKGGRARILAATLIGNVMEWFDFAVYAFVATIIGGTFFPSDDPTVQLLSALAVFGVAFFFRPVGGRSSVTSVTDGDARFPWPVPSS